MAWFNCIMRCSDQPGFEPAHALTVLEPRYPEGDNRLQVLLNESWAQVNIELQQRRIANCLEAVDLAGLYNKNVSGAAFESLAVHSPHAAALTDELNLVVGMTMRSWARAGLAAEQEHGDPGVSLIRADKLMGTPNKRQALLSNVMHL